MARIHQQKTRSSLLLRCFTEDNMCLRNLFVVLFVGLSIKAVAFVTGTFVIRSRRSRRGRRSRCDLATPTTYIYTVPVPPAIFLLRGQRGSFRPGQFLATGAGEVGLRAVRLRAHLPCVTAYRGVPLRGVPDLRRGKLVASHEAHVALALPLAVALLAVHDVQLSFPAAYARRLLPRPRFPHAPPFPRL